MPLRVIIAGAGIAGLSAAIGFARHGHDVVVLERRPQSEEQSGGSSIQLQPNAVKIIKAWGLMDKLQKIAHDSERSELRQAGSTKPFFVEDIKGRGGGYLASRNDMRDFFRTAAIDAGAKVRYDAKVAKVDTAGPTVFLEDGSTLKADFIIGADGAYSRVRYAIFPEFQPTVVSLCYFQVQVPLEFVEAHAETRELINGPSNAITCSPGRSIFSSPILSKGLFDIQLSDEHYTKDIDPHPNLRHEKVTDLSWLRARFADHGEGLRMVLEKASSYWKWRLTEVSGLPSWSSKNARVVIIGDACHSMRPHTGQGSALGVEDGAMLSEILAHMSPGDDFRSVVHQFEKHRIPRCAKMYQLALTRGRFWTLEDPELIRRRYEALSAHASTASSSLNIEPDSEASFASQSFQAWMDQYDVFEESRKVVERSNHIPARI